jgi:hypothetical protein
VIQGDGLTLRYHEWDILALAVDDLVDGLVERDGQVEQGSSLVDGGVADSRVRELNNVKSTEDALVANNVEVDVLGQFTGGGVGSSHDASDEWNSEVGTVVSGELGEEGRDTEVSAGRVVLGDGDGWDPKGSILVLGVRLLSVWLGTEMSNGQWSLNQGKNHSRLQAQDFSNGGVETEGCSNSVVGETTSSEIGGASLGDGGDSGLNRCV